MTIIEPPLLKPIKALCLAVLVTTVSVSGYAMAKSTADVRTLNNGNLVLEDIPTIPQSIVDDLNQYQNTRSAPFQAWTPDGNGIYVTTRFAETSQLHRVSAPGGARTQMTFFDEPVRAVSRQPGGKLISYTMDAGGSENAQIFLLDPDTGESTMITDGESRNGLVSWRRDGKALAYQSTQRDGRANDLWMVDVDNPDSARIILESPDGSYWAVGDWSEDGKQLLIFQYVSITDSRIHLLDLSTGELTRLRGSKDNPSANYIGGFDRSDNGFYFLTDEGSQFAKLAYQKLGSKEFKLITEDIPWDIESVAMTSDRTRMAFMANAGGVSQLYLANPSVNQYAAVEGLPIGRGSGLTFSPDGKRLALTLNTAKSPSDSFVLTLRNEKLAYGALQQWTFSEVGGLNTDTFSEPEIISYPGFDQVGDSPRQIPAVIYKPLQIDTPTPVIVAIHGGPESQYRPGFSSAVQLYVQKLGATVIWPNVRGSTGYGKDYVSLDNGYKREDSVKDIGALLDWIATQPDMDENRVIVVGGSYGGYMVLASAVHYSERLLGAVDIVGISNFVTFLENTKDYRRDLRRPEYGDERDPKMRAFLESISPNNHVEKINIPMFVVQGENDPRVPVTEAQQIVKALRERGNKVWYMNALNEGHGYRKKENQDVLGQAIIMFYQKLLNESKPSN